MEKPDKQILTISAHRIERVIRRGQDNAGATFEVHLPPKNGTVWIACVAAKARWGEEITVYHDHHTPEQAAALMSCIQMAIDWIAEERIS
jgi:hypothetical protein